LKAELRKGIGRKTAIGEEENPGERKGRIGEARLGSSHKGFMKTIITTTQHNP